ncbi:uncharacterized protein LOC128206898 [Mya arenaria]|nr:uncharacterized protein LOC128206898 [Mya arenaria]XP_052765591.1 uncharacterized protein LOC128206898 [Mya arenaria]XP_052765592.1 uncharacterized protein LOC128206898 [Mya arenaria]
MRITRELSRELVRIIDPEGVERRKRHRLRRRQYISRGPNYVWHLDGYDKLAPYGIYIHGCIDGFSRKVMWLKAGITNKRPEVIASYFIEAVNQEGGFPLRVRGDRGTENGAVAAVQRALRDSERAFLYGRSTSNQRIERWWGYLRNARADYWMNEIKLLERDNRLERADPIQRLCLQYALLPFIGRQLDEIKHLWNTHSIRNQRVGDTLPGIPDILHTQVELYGVEDYKNACSMQEMQYLHQEYENDFLNLDGEFLEIVEQVREINNLPDPVQISHFQEAKDLYVQLSSYINNL